MSENKVSGALSRFPGLVSSTMCTTSTNMIERIKKSYSWDVYYSQIIQRVVEGSGPSQFLFVDGLLRRKGRIFVGTDAELRKDILTLFHESTIMGHSCVAATSKKISILLY